MAFQHTLEKGTLQFSLVNVNTKVARATVVFDCNAGTYAIEGGKYATPAAVGKCLFDEFRGSSWRKVEEQPLFKSMLNALRLQRGYEKGMEIISKGMPLMEKLAALGLVVDHINVLLTDEYQEKIRALHFTKENVDKIKQNFRGVVDEMVIDQFDTIAALPEDLVLRFGQLVGANNYDRAIAKIREKQYNAKTLQWILYLAENKQFANLPDFMQHLRHYLSILAELKEENTYPKNFYEDYARMIGIRKARQEQILAEKQAALAGKLFFEDLGLTVVIPKSKEDIAREGRDQRNCVYNYADGAFRGDYHIVFIRRKSEPDVSYITCQIDKRGRRGQTALALNRTNFDKVAETFLKRYDEFLKQSFK